MFSKSCFLILKKIKYYHMYLQNIIDNYMLRSLHDQPIFPDKNMPYLTFRYIFKKSLEKNGTSNFK